MLCGAYFERLLFMEFDSPEALVTVVLKRAVMHLVTNTATLSRPCVHDVPCLAQPDSHTATACHVATKAQLTGVDCTIPCCTMGVT